MYCIDSLQTVNIIKEIGKNPWYIKNLYLSIKSLLNSFNMWRIVHLFKEGNRTANWLARKTNVGNECISFYCMPLETELSTIVEDYMGTVYVRN